MLAVMHVVARRMFESTKVTHARWCARAREHDARCYTLVLPALTREHERSRQTQRVSETIIP